MAQRTKQETIVLNDEQWTVEVQASGVGHLHIGGRTIPFTAPPGLVMSLQQRVEVTLAAEGFEE